MAKVTQIVKRDEMCQVCVFLAGPALDSHAFSPRSCLRRIFSGTVTRHLCRLWSLHEYWMSRVASIIFQQGLSEGADSGMGIGFCQFERDQPTRPIRGDFQSI